MTSTPLKVTVPVFETQSITVQIRFKLDVVHNSADTSAGWINFDDAVLDGPAGAVRAGDGTPIVGATVTAQGKTASTGDDGGYAIGSLTPGSTTITVSKPAYYTESRTVILIAGTNAPVDFIIAALPTSNLLAGGGFEDPAVDWKRWLIPPSRTFGAWTADGRTNNYYAVGSTSIFSAVIHSETDAFAIDMVYPYGGTFGEPPFNCVVWQNVFVQPSTEYIASV